MHTIQPDCHAKGGAVVERAGLAAPALDEYVYMYMYMYIYIFIYLFIEVWGL